MRPARHRGRRLGLVGCGRWGRNILRDLVGLGARVVVVDPAEEARRAALAGGAEGALALASALADVEGIVVATPARTHATVVESLLERRVPIFVEKPLTTDVPSARRLAARADGRLFVMDKWRYHPGIEMLARIARTGELGPLLGCQSRRMGWGVFPRDVDAVWSLAPHELSVCLEVLGHLPVATAAVLDAPSGVPAGMVGWLGREPWFVFEVSSRSHEYRREVRLLCAGGVAVLPKPDADSVLVLRASGGPGDPPAPERRPLAGDMPLERELSAFLTHLGGGPPPRSSADEGAAVVERLAELRALARGPERKLKRSRREKRARG